MFIRQLGVVKANLRIMAAVVQVPIDIDDRLKAVDDFVRWKVLYYEG
jgi:hypothetical protein